MNTTRFEETFEFKGIGKKHHLFVLLPSPFVLAWFILYIMKLKKGNNG
jgi:hypothetical protein